MTDKLPSEMPLVQLKRYSRYIKDLINQREAEAKSDTPNDEE